MEVNNYNKKFKILFEKILQRDFVISKYYSENLLRYLEHCPDAKKVLETPFFSDRVIEALSNIKNASNSGKIFLVKIISILLQNELQFTKLLYIGGLKLTWILIWSFDKQCPPELDLAAIKLATVQIYHTTGFSLLIKYKCWEGILTPDVYYKSIKVADATYTFIAKLVWKINEVEEEEALSEILEYLMTPIKQNYYHTAKIIDVENENLKFENLLPCINSLLLILSDTDNLSKPNAVVPKLTNCSMLQSSMFVILEMTKNAELALLSSELCFRFIYARRITTQNSNEALNSMEISMDQNNIVRYLLNRRMVDVTLDFVVKSIVTANKLNSFGLSSTFELNGNSYDTSIQLLIPFVVPMYINILQVNNKLDHIDEYGCKFMSMATEDTMKIVNLFQNVINSSDKSDVCLGTLRKLFLLKGHLTQPQAGMLYQGLHHFIRFYVLLDDDNGSANSGFRKPERTDIKIISLALEALKMLLKVHDIKHDNVEITSLTATLINLLQQNFPSTQLLVQLLDLIDLCITKYFIPDLSMLTKNKGDSTLEELSNILTFYIKHEDWELRDSAFQLLHTCTEFAFVKYLPFRKMITENKLIELAAHAAFHDPQFYVQSLALQCLAASAKIESIWSSVLDCQLHFWEQLIYIIKYDPEGIIRREAVKTLTKLYIYQRVSKSFTKHIYPFIATVALQDLDWEVQIEALQFWRYTIKKMLSNRGMIDGRFPAVTFSKEKRKILTLTETEIKNQLTAIINELSEIGCLTVLHKGLENEHCVRVMEKVYTIAKEFVDILDFYKFHGVVDDNESIYKMSSIKDCIMDVDVVVENIDAPLDLTCITNRNTDKVIDKILDTPQCELILDLYERQVEKKLTEEEEYHIEYTHPNTFLKTFKGKDYTTIIESKNKFNSENLSLSSLLDEILKI